MNKSLFMIAVACTTCLMVSCGKDYQKLTTEFICSMPDTCMLLVQVENEYEHLVYYKGQSSNMFFRYNAETEKLEPIVIPAVEGYDASVTIIGAGRENVMIGHNANVDNPDDLDLPQAYVQVYNLKTQKFTEFTTCNFYEFDEGTKQLSCVTYSVDRYGDGKRITYIYDLDGKLLSKKEAEVKNLNEVGEEIGGNYFKEVYGVEGVIMQAYIHDSDGSFTNLRDAPRGNTIMQIPIDGPYALDFSECKDGWWKVCGLDDFDKGVKLNPAKTYWIHYSVIAVGTRNYDGGLLCLRATPSIDGKTTYQFKGEIELRPIDVRGDWVKVSTMDGKHIGWIEVEWLCGNPVTSCC